ncbi:ATP-binding protein [Psychrobium sp. MM17-31]|uniref:ATP-binding protein n=1 Tax=Psychrobium sp. MM17-31 TaxID=2917758 RepID=UPI001EF5B0B1|nr:ATP-binding protein [Psychrobium sp. MM17-31]MCG7530941.1 ATP-binding protein [Psychrobium sp. MM17-31]
MVFKKEEFTHFSITADYLKDLAVQDVSKHSEQYDYQLPPPFSFYYSAKFISPQQWKKLCQSCLFVGRSDSVEYYEFVEGERIAYFSTVTSMRGLLIYEKTDEERVEGEESELHIDELDSPFFLILCLVLIFVSLYWPLKKMHRQIYGLNKAQKRFGRGDMSARADEDILRPLNDIAISFNNMAEAIDKSVKEKEVFAHAIPHEIRTPLSRIQLAAGLLRQQSSDDKVAALLDDVDAYIVDINELISQIVNFSKLTNSKSAEYYQNYETIFLSDFIKSRMALVTVPSDKSIALNICSEARITTNPVYLRLVVDNLIKNALIYANRQVNIIVYVESGEVYMLVEDDGVGIDSTSYETVFIPFARLDSSRSRKTGGIGLGLSITKAAVLNMRGTIDVGHSALGGASFTVTMPLDG